MQHASQNPFFNQIKREHLTEDELNSPVKVVKIKIWGDYTCRGEHRKEVIVRDYEGEVEVPAKFHGGHVKLAANRYIKNEKKGIRARHVFYDKEDAGEPQEHKRKVREFMSSQGIRDNESLKRAYDREIAQRRAEAENMHNGIAPEGVTDDSMYGRDGLPKFSEKTYVAQ